MASFILLVGYLLLSLCRSQVAIQVNDGNGGFFEGFRRASPHASWTKYIQCETCQYASQKMYYMLDSFRGGHDWGEDLVLDVLHDICNPMANIGLWATTIDLYVDVERYLTFDENDKFGMCFRECETIAKACQEVISDNAEELGEWIWANADWMKKDTLQDFVCDSVCGDNDGKIKVPKKKKKKERMGKEEWIEMTQDELERRRGLLNQIPKYQQKWGKDRLNAKPDL